jgi:hypothetical protein
MTEHRYPVKALRGDYVRTAIGLALTAVPLALADVGTAGAVVLAALVVLFGVYGLRTALRQRTTVRLDAPGILQDGPMPRAIRWDELASVDLSYYTTKKDRGAGWMQLKIRGSGTTMTIESTIAGFPELVGGVFQEAQAKGLELTPATLNNARALGVKGIPPQT